MLNVAGIESLGVKVNTSFRQVRGQLVGQRAKGGWHKGVAVAQVGTMTGGVNAEADHTAGADQRGDP